MFTTGCDEDRHQSVKAEDAGVRPPAEAGEEAQTPSYTPPAPLAGIVAEPDDAAATLYDPGQLRTYELTVAEEDLRFLDQNPRAEQYVRGSLRVDGETVENVGIRYKGSVGAFIFPCTPWFGGGAATRGTTAAGPTSTPDEPTQSDEPSDLPVEKLASTDIDGGVADLFDADGGLGDPAPSPDGDAPTDDPAATTEDTTQAPAKYGKCSVKVSFNEYVPKREFHGVRKLLFHSMNHDRSMLRDRLAYQMFREQGLAAPRSVHARLVINGKFEGLFALVEQVDGRFTRSRFTEGGTGNLYKEVWPLHSDPAVYENALTTNEDDAADVSAFVAFHEAVTTGDRSLAGFIDPQAIMRWLAADRVMMNDDGPLHFWCGRGGQGNNPGGFGNHNYYWYQRAADEHFTLIPWDMDSSLAGSAFVHIRPQWRATAGCGCVGTLVPASCDDFVQWLLTEERAFEVAVDEFIAGPFNAVHVDALLSQWSHQISAAVRENAERPGAPSFEQWRSSVESLRSAIASMRKHRGYDYENNPMIW